MMIFINALIAVAILADCIGVAIVVHIIAEAIECRRIEKQIYGK